MDPEDVHPAASELDSGGGTESAGCAEDEGPALQLWGRSHEAAPLRGVCGRWILPSQLSGPIVGEGLGDFRFGVHDERPIRDDRLTNWRACPQDRLKRGVGGDLELARLELLRGPVPPSH